MTFTEIKEAFEAAGHEPRSYSGRGMYGKECLGVDCDSPVDLVLDVLAEADLADMPDLFEALRGARTDAMGRGTIVYWPKIGWAANEKE